MIDWKSGPISITKFDPLQIKIMIGIDESGNLSGAKENLKKIACGKLLDDNDRFLTICASIIQTENINTIKGKNAKLKKKYWSPQGKFNDKCVVLHNVAIEHKKEPFNMSKSIYDDFVIDLSDYMSKMPYGLVFIDVDLYAYYRFMQSPENNMLPDVYSWMLKELIKEINNHMNNLNFIVIIESRDMFGAKDRYAHQLLIEEISKNKMLKSLLKGIYFNPKCNPTSLSQNIAIELADLCAGPHNKYFNKCIVNKIEYTRKDIEIIHKKTLQYYLVK